MNSTESTPVELLSTEKKQRIYYLDYLRVFATFAVVVIHVVAQLWYSEAPKSFNWQILNIYNSLSRWAVPIFVMISGVVFLQRDIKIRNIYTKYIPRLAVAYLLWQFLYAAVGGGRNVKETIFATVTSITRYHLWYIPMIIGIYMCIPILKTIVTSEKTTKYFLGIAFIFTYLLPQLIMIASHFFSEPASDMISSVLDKFDFYIISGYSSYFIAGYVLNKVELSKLKRRIIYILGVFGFISTIVCTVFISLILNTQIDYFYGYLTVNILFCSLAVFVWFKYNVHSIPKLDKIISKMSQYSFGTYLVHVFVMETLQHFGFGIKLFNPIFSVPIVSLLIFIVSFAISAILNQIPILKKYIV